MTLAERIIELVPEIQKRPSRLVQLHPRDIPPTNMGPEITLVDVLRAIHATGSKESKRLHVCMDGIIGVISPVAPMTHVEANWDLAADLDGQIEQTKAYLSKLLEV